MRKKLMMLCILALLGMTVLTGCGEEKQKTESKVEKTESPVETPEATLTATPSATPTETVEELRKQFREETLAETLPDEITGAEEVFSITDMAKRKEAMERIGEKDYWTGIKFARLVVHLQGNLNSPINDTLESNYSEYTAKDVKLVSDYDGTIIPGDYVLANGEEDNSTVIFLQGYGCNRRTQVSLMKKFLNLGYNIVSYDQRRTGENDAPYFTLGYLEQNDLKQYIQFIDEKLSEGNKIYLYALSQSGLTACRVLGSEFGNEKLDGAILDCVETSVRDSIKAELTNYVSEDAMESTFESIDKVLAYYVDGFTTADGEMTEYMKKTTVPVLVLTSDCDTVVNKSYPLSIYDAVPGKKALYISDQSSHCQISSKEPNKYKELLTGFFDGSIFE